MVNFPRPALEAAGYIAPEHKKYLAEIEHKMNDAGLGAEFKYHGVLDRDEKIAILENTRSTFSTGDLR